MAQRFLYMKLLARNIMYIFFLLNWNNEKENSLW